MKVGIVGHEAAKFTPETEKVARTIIQRLCATADIVISGHCHLGGIDIWVEEIAGRMEIQTMIFAPKTYQWETGYKPRNLLIAKHSDIVHCIVVAKMAKYPSCYDGMKFDVCYHCGTRDHTKSGGCWTAKRAKKAQWHVI